MISKENLDKRICDVVEGATNTLTYREYIREFEQSLNLMPAPLDSLEDEKLKDWLELIDYLILK
jgi:hypothetical protein